MTNEENNNGKVVKETEYYKEYESGLVQIKTDFYGTGKTPSEYSAHIISEIMKECAVNPAPMMKSILDNNKWTHVDKQLAVAIATGIKLRPLIDALLLDKYGKEALDDQSLVTAVAMLKELGSIPLTRGGMIDHICSMDTQDGHVSMFSAHVPDKFKKPMDFDITVAGRTIKLKGYHVIAGGNSLHGDMVAHMMVKRVGKTLFYASSDSVPSEVVSKITHDLLNRFSSTYTNGSCKLVDVRKGIEADMIKKGVILDPKKPLNLNKMLRELSDDNGSEL
jgi:hypothetical protein